MVSSCTAPCPRSAGSRRAEGQYLPRPDAFQYARELQSLSVSDKDPTLVRVCSVSSGIFAVDGEVEKQCMVLLQLLEGGGQVKVQLGNVVLVQEILVRADALHSL